MVLSTVQHVGSVDELVAGAAHPQLRLSVSQNYLPPVGERECTQLSDRARVRHQPVRGWTGNDGNQQHHPSNQLCCLLGITGQGGEVQLVLCPEDHVLGSDLQDGRWLQGGGDSEESKLGWQHRSIFRLFVLPMKEFQPALKV